MYGDSAAPAYSKTALFAGNLFSNFHLVAVYQTAKASSRCLAAVKIVRYYANIMASLSTLTFYRTRIIDFDDAFQNLYRM